MGTGSLAGRGKALKQYCFFRIFISDVLPGPAFGNLVVGDIILKINGIDMTKAEKPQATTILKGLDFDYYVMMTSLLCHTC